MGTRIIGKVTVARIPSAMDPKPSESKIWVDRRRVMNLVPTADTMNDFDKLHRCPK